MLGERELTAISSISHYHVEVVALTSVEFVLSMNMCTFAQVEIEIAKFGFMQHFSSLLIFICHRHHHHRLFIAVFYAGISGRVTSNSSLIWLGFYS